MKLVSPRKFTIKNLAGKESTSNTKYKLNLNFIRHQRVYNLINFDLFFIIHLLLIS